VKRVRHLGLLNTEAKSPFNNRGKHLNRANAKSNEVIQNIDNHINSFPFKISHYGCKGERMRYLPTDLSIVKMYTSFLRKILSSRFFIDITRRRAYNFEM
jgi:hypothetical protein